MFKFKTISQSYLLLAFLAILSITIAIAFAGLKLLTSEAAINKIPNIDKAYRLCLHDSTFNMESVQIPLDFPISALSSIPAIESFTTSLPFDGSVELSPKDEKEVSVCGTDSSYFGYWNLKWTGQTKLDAGSVAISVDLAKIIFGDKKQAIGNNLTLTVGGQKKLFTVRTLFKEQTKLTYRPDIIVSIPDALELTYTKVVEEPYISRNSYYRIDLMVNGTIDHQLKSLYSGKKSGKSPGFFLEPVSSIYFETRPLLNDYHDKGNPNLSLFINIFCIFILLAASLNIAIFFNGTSLIKAKDYAVRKVVGATPKSIFFSIMLRTAVILIPSFIIGIALHTIFIKDIYQFIGIKDLYFIQTSPIFVIAALLLILITVSLSGAFSALFISRISPATVITGGSINTKLRNRFFTIVQCIQILVFASAFLCVSGIKNQFRFINRYGVGMKSEELYIVDVSEWKSERVEQFKHYLETNPSVSSFSRARIIPPFQGGAFFPAPSLKNPEVKTPSLLIAVDYNFASTFGLSFIQGEDFKPDNCKSGGSYFIINETALKALGVNTVVGEPWMEGVILGVVKDFFPRSAKEEILPVVISFKPERTKQLLFRLRDKHKLKDIIQFKNSIESDNSKPIKYYPAIVEDFYQDDYLVLRIVNAIAIFTIIIGLFGVISMVYFTNIIKQKDYAIRKILGADILDIASILYKRFSIIFIISSVPAYLLARIFIAGWSNGFVYKAPNSPAVDLSFLVVLYLTLYLFSSIQLWYFNKINISSTLKVN
ncbi:MAG: FtsX-like permease family protein [Bacteroidales bacterium]|nr:FtsX-like permease family protein [Bacteroidales bacterium]